jgi:hypothetical protein
MGISCSLRTLVYPNILTLRGVGTREHGESRSAESESERISLFCVGRIEVGSQLLLQEFPARVARQRLVE